MNNTLKKYLLNSYDYKLPPCQIAQSPIEPRDSSKLLVVKKDGTFEETIFRKLPEYLEKGDLLVLNDTKVFPARIFGKKSTGGRIELLLLESIHAGIWKVLVRPSRRLHTGDKIYFDIGLIGEIIGYNEDGTRVIEFNFKDRTFFDVLDKIAHIPLPPYIRRSDTESDRSWYQTVYAQKSGAVAAPTAGLHFTEQLLREIEKSGIEITKITLHIGWGTFKPIKCSDIRNHKMHSEYYEISKKAAEKINTAISQCRRIIAVGTTTTRALESAARNSLPLKAQKRWTDLFIYPGFRFQVVDCMVTNFHLPKSSLLVMVSAFAGIETIKRAYCYAIEHNFRFYSYGDAMLILRKKNNSS